MANASRGCPRRVLSFQGLDAGGARYGEAAWPDCPTFGGQREVGRPKVGQKTALTGSPAGAPPSQRRRTGQAPIRG